MSQEQEIWEWLAERYNGGIALHLQPDGRVMAELGINGYQRSIDHETLLGALMWLRKQVEHVGETPEGS